jgi:hypothetical protein
MPSEHESRVDSALPRQSHHEQSFARRPRSYIRARIGSIGIEEFVTSFGERSSASKYRLFGVKVNHRSCMLITSINPWSNLAHQLRCFQRWKSLGFLVRSANTAAEADHLTAAGVPRGEILFVSDLDSSIKLFGKPIPRIAPLLSRVEKEYTADIFVLTNADIYPAVRSRLVASYWVGIADAIGLTREECHALEAHSFLSRAPYRGGLDAFCVSRRGLESINRILSRLDSADRMTFGIPGWDYLLGASILSSEVNGRIMDSGTLLHVSHRTTYGNLAEFQNYTRDMVSLGAATTIDPVPAANEFSARIWEECARSTSLTRLGVMMYFMPVERVRTMPQSAFIEEVVELVEAVAPHALDDYRILGLRSLIDRLIQEGGRNVEMAFKFLVASPSSHCRFSQTLMAIYLTLQCGLLSQGYAFTEIYPQGNQHRPALENIMSSTREDSPDRRVLIAQLFGVELLQYQIFNPRLYNYLVWNCINHMERQLLVEIRRAIESVETVT